MVIDRLLSRFRDPVELDDPADAADVFRAERDGEIEDVRDRFEELQDATRDALADLDDALADLAAYEDAQGRSMIEDVLDNVVRERRDAIATVDADRPRAFVEAVEGFVDDFLEMTQKESMVLDAVGEAKQPVLDALDAVKSRRDDLQRFLDADHRMLERERDLRDAVDRLEDLRAERARTADELDDIDVEAVREEQQEAREALEELREGEDWAEYETAREALEAAREDRAAARREVERAMNAMERGLKKMVYEVEHGDLAVDADLSRLKAVREGDLDAVMSEPGAVAGAVDAAAEALPGDLLGERQAGKFRDGAERLADLPDLAAEHDRLDGRVAELETEVEGHPVLDREEELEAAVEQLEERVAARAERRKELRARREELEEEIAELEDEIVEMLEEALDRDVVRD